MQAEAVGSELELGDYIRILRRRWPYVVLSLVTIVGLGLAFSITQQATYQATARVLITASDAQEELGRSNSNSSFLTRELTNELNLAQGDQVERSVEATLGDLPDVNVRSATGGDILEFVAVSATPEEAAEAANTWANAYINLKREQAQTSIDTAVQTFRDSLTGLRNERQSVRSDLDALEDQLARATNESAIARLETQIRRLEADLAPEMLVIDAQIEEISSSIARLQLSGSLVPEGTAQMFDQAFEPTEKSNAPLSRNLALSVVVGSIVAIAAALLADNLDRTIKTIEDLRAAVKIPFLGSVQKAPRHLTDKELALAALHHPEGPIADGYHQIRTALQFAFLGRDVNSLLITSANQSEAKTTSSSNLACAMSAVGLKVVLADVDFRRPRVHEVYGCEPEPGLSNHLIDGTPLHELVLTVEEANNNLVIMPSGSPPPSPGDLVGTPAFVDVIRLMEKEADLVILDAPPVLPVSDALTLARSVDSVMVVVYAGSTTRDQIRRTIESLTQVGAEIAGAVLVGVRFDPAYGNYGYDNQPVQSPWKRVRSAARLGG